MSPELKEKVERLCECLTKAMHERWEHTIDKVSFDYSVGQKYIRIINCEHGDHRSVWGFINKKEWSKPSGITFREGDILKSAGWKTPALNAPRGNLFDGYRIDPNSMRIYGPDYLR
jgi:hypothetical protein|tara:strand:- start:1208 stop:1555 length:348 start_codon:yes stop_codon:yes gene_type:complete